MGVEGLLEKGFITTRADQLINWARTGSMWPMSFRVMIWIALASCLGRALVNRM